VQSPVGLDELAQRLVVGDRRLPKLLSADPIGLELDRIALAVERAGPLPPALVPPQLPLAVRLAD
jgi:hypothetical protein